MDGKLLCAVKIPISYYRLEIITIQNGHLKINPHVYLDEKSKKKIDNQMNYVKQELRCWLHLQLGRRMTDALYTPQKNINISPDWLEDIQEARHVQNMRGHPFIHPILEFSLTIPCIVSELCSGDLIQLCLKYDHSLFCLQTREHSPSKIWEQAMTSIASGLCYMHNVGVAHGDLKPPNVLYKQTGHNSYHFYISDFGGYLHTKKRVKRTLGTPAYDPPRRIREEFLPEGCDAYAFAVTGLELLLTNKKTDFWDWMHNTYIPHFTQIYADNNRMIAQLIQIYRGDTTDAFYDSFLLWCGWFCATEPPRQRPPNHYAQHAGGERQQVGGLAPQQLPRPRPRQPDLGCTCC
jgi:serine/threonine protein kinase